MTPEQRKNAAKQLEKNPLLEECFENCIKKLFDAWQADPNSQDRDHIWHKAKALQLLRIDIYAAVKSALRDGQQTKLDS